MEMRHELLDRPQLQRYLRALGVSRREPTLPALEELVAAHLTRIPFENVSKLYYRRRYGLASVPDTARFLAGIEQCHFGGTCYTNNSHFFSLLASLGYDVRLCAADMNAPDVHMVIVLLLDGREYLIDAGYAAPFCSPLPRDLKTDYVLELGRDRYILKPQDSGGCSRLELYRDGELKHRYMVKPAPRRIEDFSGVIADSFRPGATFLNSLLVTRAWQDRSVMIHNLALIEAHGTNYTIRKLAGRDELAARVEEFFGIPREVVAEAVGELRELEDPWGVPGTA
jgi:N-hydroxyarylamine O-acetyltransferase